MHSISYTSVGDREFTKELLDSNFAAIGEYSIKMGNVVAALNEKSNAMSADIHAMAKIVTELQKPKTPSQLLPFAAGIVVGFYLYNNRQKAKELWEKATQEAAEQRKDETIKTESERTDKSNS